MNPTSVKELDPSVWQDIPMVQVTIPNSTTEARKVQDEIEKQLQALSSCSDRDLFSIKLALEEAIVNAVKHGNQLDPTKKVHIEYHVSEERFQVEVTDEGDGFNPLDVPDPTAIENLDRPCGRGLMLMQHYMTDIRYNDKGNSVRMMKEF